MRPLLPVSKLMHCLLGSEQSRDVPVQLIIVPQGGKIEGFVHVEDGEFFNTLPKTYG